MNPALLENFMDPQVLKKGLEEIKEQMRDVQKEAHEIENQMESRFFDMVGQREAKLRGMPKSITEEVENAENQLTQGIESGFVKTRQLVIERLGGPFDYTQYDEDLRQLRVEREQLKRQFKQDRLLPPDFGENDFKGKAFYDFSVSPMPDSFEQKLKRGYEGTTVSYEKPAYVDELKS